MAEEDISRAGYSDRVSHAIDLVNPAQALRDLDEPAPAASPRTKSCRRSYSPASLGFVDELVQSPPTIDCAGPTWHTRPHFVWRGTST